MADGANEAIKLAIKIAKSETRGRNYRDDVIGDVLLAVAEGERSREGLERVCRRSIRREWRRDKRFVAADADQASGNPQYAELWEAMRALTPRQYEVVHLIFWGGLTQEEVAARLGVSHQYISLVLLEARKILKKTLSGLAKRAFPMPLVGESR